MPRPYGPVRVWKTFRFLQTIFLIVVKRERFLFLRPLPPRKFKNTILELGVCFIKLAQVLATRADFLTHEYLVELRTIHDEVPPMDYSSFRTVFERAFEHTSPFSSFWESPLASATIGQVHKATLMDGTQVAVKLRRLDVEKVIEKDLRTLNAILKFFKPFLSSHTKNSLDTVLKEFSAMITKEADLSLELENLKKFKDIYKLKDIYFPNYFEEFSNKDVLVLSFEEGVRIDDRNGLEKKGIPFKKVIDHLINFYCEQMLVRGFFHCDPHPGNILVRDDGGLIFLDFGMVKRLSYSARIAMIEMAKYAHERDYERYIAACKRLGVVSAAAPETEMQAFSERMFDIFSNEHLSASTMQALALDVLFSMKDFPFKLPPEVVYVLRASSLVEGLGTSYIENFNGVKDILPALMKNLPRAMGAESNLISICINEATNLPLTLHKLKTIITNLSSEDLHIKISRETLELVAESLKGHLMGIALGTILILASFYLLNFSFPFNKILSLIFFTFGAFRIFSTFK